MEALFSLVHGVMFSVFGPVIFVIQIICVVHVFKTGRPFWWIWIILALPPIGIIAYVIVEIRPTMRKFDVQSFLWRLKSPQQRIAILDAQLEHSPTVKNRLALASELHQAGEFDRECAVLGEGLRGAFKDDAQLMMRLAQSHLAAARVEEAHQLIEKTTPDRSSDSQLQLALLKARVAAQQGKFAEAEPIFQSLIERGRSEAPRYYLADAMLQSGRTADGQALLRDILYRYGHGTPVWRYQERPWFYAAKRRLKQRDTAAANGQ
jgi:hypothetical protein